MRGGSAPLHRVGGASAPVAPPASYAYVTLGTMSNSSHSTTVDSQTRTSLKQYLRTGYNETTRREVRMYESSSMHSDVVLYYYNDGLGIKAELLDCLMN